ncbi:MAG: carbohydrate kinase [Gemmataceae bacterium]|nr:carbohydrate kinase [Gemmataceae bacterium]
MLTDARVETILERIPRLTIGVVGDLFLDRYLDIDAALTEPSIETGLDAYQVVRVRSSPGAAGTVINNLVALGVQRVVAVSVIGDDGEGYELRQALAKQRVVDTGKVFASPERRTPTYTKPMLGRSGEPPRELNRLDIKNRTPMPAALQDAVMEALDDVWPQLDALLVMDQVSEEDCGVVTMRVREVLRELGKTNPDKFVLADSRERIGLFRSVALKPNSEECCRAVYQKASHEGNLDMFAAVARLAERAERAVFCTHGKTGIHVVNGRGRTAPLTTVPAYPVSGPIDIVGAGDSTSAAIGCAMAAGVVPEEAAAFGNLVASITIQQIGTTGTASPEQVRRRWREVRS